MPFSLVCAFVSNKVLITLLSSSTATVSKSNRFKFACTIFAY